MSENKTKTNFAFFGSSEFSVFCLAELKTLGHLPALIVTSPDKPTGRGLKLEANPVKLWALTNRVEFLTPQKLDSDFTSQLTAFAAAAHVLLFLVASYGKIIPKNIIDLPSAGTLNIHPSLLPKYRGPAPLQEQILKDEQNVGVTIMLLDEKVDTGPIVAQKNIIVPDWPVKFETLEKVTADEGAKLFTEILPDWLAGKIPTRAQDSTQATFTKKVEKTDSLLDPENGDPYKNWLKIQAYRTWPQAYFLVTRAGQPIRVIVKDAAFKNGQLQILRVLPAGKKEMSYKDFCLGLKQ